MIWGLNRGQWRPGALLENWEAQLCTAQTLAYSRPLLWGQPMQLADFTSFAPQACAQPLQ